MFMVTKREIVASNMKRPKMKMVANILKQRKYLIILAIWEPIQTIITGETIWVNSSLIFLLKLKTFVFLVIRAI